MPVLTVDPLFLGVAMSKKKYTDQMIIDAVKQSKTNIEVCKIIGAPTSGGSYGMIGARIKNLQLDTSHFVRSTARSTKRKPVEKILSLRENGMREKTAHLRRALLEKQIPLKCSIEGCTVSDEWNSKSITLEIDHINRNPLDNRIENLRFVCPNCHSQL